MLVMLGLLKVNLSISSIAVVILTRVCKIRADSQTVGYRAHVGGAHVLEAHF